MTIEELKKRVSILEADDTQAQYSDEISPEDILSIFKDILRLGPERLYQFREVVDVAREIYPDEVNALLEGREYLLFDPSERTH
jgi:hypothetical protein